MLVVEKKICELVIRVVSMSLEILKYSYKLQILTETENHPIYKLLYHHFYKSIIINTWVVKGL